MPGASCQELAKPTGPCLFLSHSGADTEAARKLRERILDTPDAKAAGLRIWFDKDPNDLQPGQDWQSQIERAVTETATAFAVYIGSNGIVNWVEREVRLGLSRATGKDNFPFIPILARDSTGSSMLPPFAAQFHGVRDPLNDETQLVALIKAVLCKTDTAQVIFTEQPFIGLRSMTESWSDRFFGRHTEVDEVLAIMRRRKLVAIVAESGAGKSSLAQAGVIPKFRGGALEGSAGRQPDAMLRHVVVMRPGAEPLEGLKDGVSDAAEKLRFDSDQRHKLRARVSATDAHETAYAIRCDLPAKETQTLLIVDQFEELLTQAQEIARTQFIELLLKLLSKDIQILITIRSDYFNLLAGHGALYSELARDNDASIYRLRRITDSGIDEAVSRPLIMAGYAHDEIKPLTNLFKRDMMDRPGDLALLQMALEAVWRRRGQNGGLLAAYATVGGISGALAYEADNVRLNKLDDQEQNLLVPLFARLIKLGDTGGVTRRPALVSEIGEARVKLARRLTTEECSRLLVTSSPDTVEIAHEALITQWTWLQNQLGGKETPFAIRRLGQLMEDTAQWRSSPSASKRENLANEGDYSRYIDLIDKRSDWPSEAEKQFIVASGKSLSRAKMFQRLLTYGSMTVAAIIGSLLLWAISQSLEAKRQTYLALRNQTGALAALSEVTLSQRPNEAMKLALAAWPRDQNDPTPRLRVGLNAIGNALLTPRKHQLLDDDGEILQIAWSPNGTQIAVILAPKLDLTKASGFPSADWEIRVVSATTGARSSLYKDGNAVSGLSWSPDGKRLAATLDNKHAQIWNVATPEEITVLLGNTARARHLQWSPDGKYLAATSSDIVVNIWDSTGNLIGELPGHSESINSLAWRPDGTQLITGSDDGTARIWNLASLETSQILTHGSPVEQVVWHPYAPLLATRSRRTISMWSSETGLGLPILRTEKGTYRKLSWSPDGELLAALSNMGMTIRSDATGQKREILSEKQISVRDLSWRLDGMWFAAVSTDGSIIIQHAYEDKRSISLNGHTQSVRGVAWSPRGAQLATISNGNRLVIWDIPMIISEKALPASIAETGIIAWSPNGMRLAATSRDNSVQIWDTATRKMSVALRGHVDQITDIEWSPDGTRLATASDDGRAIVWDTTTGRSISVLDEHNGDVNDVAWSSTGKFLATASDDRTVRIWNAETGLRTQLLDGHENAVLHVAWSPDGKDTRLMTVAVGGRLRIWKMPPESSHIAVSGPLGNILGKTWSPDGKFFAATSADHDLGLWNSEDGKEFAPIDVTPIVGHFSWSPDGRQFAVVTVKYSTDVRIESSRVLSIWNFMDQTKIKDISLAGEVTDTSWSDDGSKIATVAIDRDGRSWIGQIWDAATGKEIVTLRMSENQGRPKRIMWINGDRRVAIEMSNKTIVFWDARTGEQIFWPLEYVRNFTFNSDDTWLATVAPNNSIRLVNLESMPAGDIFHIACFYLRDFDVTDLARDYDIRIIQPICQTPDQIPLPPWTEDWIEGIDAR